MTGPHHHLLDDVKRLSSGFLLFSCLLGVSVADTHQSELSINLGLAKIPNLSTLPSDPIPSLFSDMSEVIDGQFNIEILPFGRSVGNVKSADQDMHFPALYNPDLNLDDKSYVYSSVAAWSVDFVLYSHVDSELEVSDFGDSVVGTDHAYVEFLGPRFHPFPDIVRAIKMVDAGRLDAFVFPGVVVDPIIKKLQLGNIRRRLYSRFEARSLISTGSDVEAIDKRFTEGVKQMRESGTLTVLADRFGVAYDNWQPFEHFAP